MLMLRQVPPFLFLPVKAVWVNIAGLCYRDSSDRLWQTCTVGQHRSGFQCRAGV